MRFIKHVLPLLLALSMLTTALVGCGHTSDIETKTETNVETATKAPATDPATDPVTEEATEKATEVETTAKETETDSINEAETATEPETNAEPGTGDDIPLDKKLKVGFILLHDENASGSDNFLQAALQACQDMNVDIVVKKNIPESAECKEAADDLVAQGCSVIFAASFGHEDYMIEAAREYTDVQFCHATGTKAHTEGLANYHNAFASIYEGRYLAGIAAGMKLVEMYGDAEGNVSDENAVMGYVGAFCYTEVISGYTSFYLGAKSVCPNVTMKVTFTGSWYDEAKEWTAAKMLISEGCKLISQHADSMGAPRACETAGIPNVSYNGSTKEACPNTFIVSSRIDWTPYMEYMIQQVQKGEAIAIDWTGTLSTGSVVLTEINEDVAAKGTKEAIAAAEKALREGTLHVFDTNTFTVSGEKLTSYMADVDTDYEYTPDTEVVSDGYFHESEYRSAPYFNVEIDGITLLDRDYG